MIVTLKLVAENGDVQDHLIRMNEIPRMGEWLLWDKKTKLAFSVDLDQHIRVADPEWEGSYIVRKVEHFGPVQTTVWAHTS